MAKPTKLHLLAVKRILRYLKWTIELGIFYKKKAHEGLVGYTYSDYAGDLEDKNNIFGYAFIMGLGVVSWFSRKQPIVTLLTI